MNKYRYGMLLAASFGLASLAACKAEAPAPSDPPSTEVTKGDGVRGDPCGRRGNNPDTKCP